MRSMKQHKDATKALQKAPKRIQQKAIEWFGYFLEQNEVDGSRFEIKPLKGKLKIYQEVKLDKDYRIIFRLDKKSLYIRKAGTHNQLGTG